MSVDVGDVKERVVGIDGCFVVDSREPIAIAELLQKAMAFEGKTTGRTSIFNDDLDNNQVAERLIGIYKEIVR